MTRVVLITCGIWVLAGAGCVTTQTTKNDAATASAAAPEATEISAVHPVDDNVLRDRFGAQLGALKDAGQTGDIEALRQQLADRRSCQLDLPPMRVGQLTTADLYRTCRPSTLIVGNVYKCGRCSNWHTGMASGFAIGPDVVVTNHHVMSNKQAAAFAVMTAAGDVYPIIEILASNDADDAAIVRVEIPAGRRPLQSVPVAVHAPVGARVAVISHPTNQFYTYTEGMVSRYASFRKGRNAPESVRMSITADYAKGSSGGPVFDTAGNVCGMVSSTNSIYYNRDDDGHETNLQMVIKSCVPSAAILNLIATPTNP